MENALQIHRRRYLHRQLNYCYQAFSDGSFQQRRAGNHHHKKSLIQPILFENSPNCVIIQPVKLATNKANGGGAVASPP